jgi:hypothetical protein
MSGDIGSCAGGRLINSVGCLESELRFEVGEHVDRVSTASTSARQVEMAPTAVSTPLRRWLTVRR